MTTLPTVLAIDPGRDQSAWIVLDGDGHPERFGIDPNAKMLDIVHDNASCRHMAIEMVASYGMTVGADIFQTCVWIGRFIQAWQPIPWTMVLAEKR